MTHRLDLNQAKSVSPLTAAKNGQATEPTHNPAPGLDLEAMEQLPYAMGMMAPGGRALFVNDAIVRMLGYPDAQSLLNTPMGEVIAQPQAFLRLIELMETHGVARGYEIELIRYNGKSIWMVVTVHEVVTVNGLAWQIALIDITDRILAERADAESRDRYQTVFEQSPSALWQIDFSALQGWFDGLRAAGIKDLRDHLERHPEDAEQACSLVSFGAIRIRFIF